jgi:uncharacterized cupredoxin-like copper-binding protein
VPEGFRVNITFVNRDPVNAHSLAIMNQIGDYPAIFVDPVPAFEGAMSPNATDAAKALAPGGSQNVAFVAARAGHYAMICVLPAHALTGMWVRFDVSADGSAGVRGWR